MDLEKLFLQVTEDGVVDCDEVDVISGAIYEDGVIDRQEADFMFRVNDAVSGNDNCPAWKDLFVQALSDHIMEDGIIDGEELAYLEEKIGMDGQVDDVERALIEELKVRSGKHFPVALEAILNAK